MDIKGICKINCRVFMNPQRKESPLDKRRLIAKQTMTIVLIAIFKNVAKDFSLSALSIFENCGGISL